MMAVPSLRPSTRQITCRGPYPQPWEAMSTHLQRLPFQSKLLQVSDFLCGGGAADELWHIGAFVNSQFRHPSTDGLLAHAFEESAEIIFASGPEVRTAGNASLAFVYPFAMREAGVVGAYARHFSELQFLRCP